MVKLDGARTKSKAQSSFVKVYKKVNQYMGATPAYTS